MELPINLIPSVRKEGTLANRYYENSRQMRLDLEEIERNGSPYESMLSAALQATLAHLADEEEEGE